MRVASRCVVPATADQVDQPSLAGGSAGVAYFLLRQASLGASGTPLSSNYYEKPGLVETLDEPELAGEMRKTGARLAAMNHPQHLEYLGLAHGSAAIALSQLRWSQATEQPATPETISLLDLLLGHRRPSGRWPMRPDSRDVRRGWCHGSGIALLELTDPGRATMPLVQALR